jgi:hypothetical protein
MPPFNRHFFERTQPTTSCVVTAAFLDSLISCTTSGLKLMDSLLCRMSTLNVQRPSTTPFQVWAYISQGLPLMRRSPQGSDPLLLPVFRGLRTSVHQLEVDMKRLSGRADRSHPGTAIAAPLQGSQPLELAQVHITSTPNSASRTNSGAPRRSAQRLPTTQRGSGSCLLCGRLGHIQTLCKDYRCAYCNTAAPGHFAKFCTANPYRGIAARDLPSEALDRVRALARGTPLPPTIIGTHPGTPSTTNATPGTANSAPITTVGSTPNTASRLLQSGELQQPALAAKSHTRAGKKPAGTSTPKSSATTTTKLGPVYKPTFLVKVKGNPWVSGPLPLPLPVKTRTLGHGYG